LGSREEANREIGNRQVGNREGLLAHWLIGYCLYFKEGNMFTVKITRKGQITIPAEFEGEEG